MIRLARYGAKKKPFYHVVAIDKRRARNAICTEKLGFYHPMDKYAQLNLERVKYWLSTGAKCSETAAKLIKKYEKGELQQSRFQQKVEPKNKSFAGDKMAKTEKAVAKNQVKSNMNKENKATESKEPLVQQNAPVKEKTITVKEPVKTEQPKK
jgi:small subunit ribosomal protein S16